MKQIAIAPAKAIAVNAVFNARGIGGFGGGGIMQYISLTQLRL
jgi:hypothetical protein